jgi:hypothetical protein
MPEFLGLPCVELANESLSLLVTESVGPRILSLRVHGGENLFAEIPDFTLHSPDTGKLRLWGGHRLWVAPEVPRTTWRPDDQPVIVRTTRRGLEITGPTDDLTGLEKSLEIELQQTPRAAGIVVVDHTLRNRGSQPVSGAPWAITQFKTGGFAILYHKRTPQDELGLQSDREISLWPYTDIRSPCIEWGNEYTFVHARMTSGALKLGFPKGLLGYHRKRTLFIKTAYACYPPRGSMSECYCNDRFLELETLGPVVTIQPGESVMHREAWWLYDNVDLEPTEASMSSLRYPELKEAP